MSKNNNTKNTLTSNELYLPVKNNKKVKRAKMLGLL
jgi:hypothetical protein